MQYKSDRIFFNVITCEPGKAWSVHQFGELRRWAVEAETESGARARLERRGHTIHAVCSIYPIDQLSSTRFATGSLLPGVLSCCCYEPFNGWR